MLLPVFLFIVEYYPHGMECTTLCLSIHQLMSICCSHFLTFINNATTNIQVEDFVVSVITSLGKSLGEDLLGQEVNACLFKKLPNCFSKWLCIYAFPPKIHESSD